ncbi:MAG: branched-chain amino acid ABC transporter substrate-binding protein [Pseudorhizobium sp.]
MSRTWSLATAVALPLLFPPLAASAATIGVVAPTSGPYALLGAQAIAGARAAADATGDTLVEINEDCEAGAPTAVAQRLIEAGAAAAIGFLCVETLSGALPQLATAGIPAVTLSVRSTILMEDALRENWPLFRLSPADGDEAERISEVILERWSAEPIALIDDGTIYGRELTSSVRRQIESGGLTPVFVDTYRPSQEQQVALVRRLAQAGATRIFVGGDRNDIAIIARDAAEENIPLQILGGDTMRAANRPVALRDGVMAVALPDYSAQPSATDAAATLRSASVEPEGYALPAYAAVQIVGQAVAAGSTQPLTEVLLATQFQSAIGPVDFDERHELAHNPLSLQEWRGNRFVTIDVATE